MDSTATPIIDIVPGVGFRVTTGEVSATGASLPEAMSALRAAIAARYDTEKGDEAAASRDAARQTDLVNNDRFIQGNVLQNQILLGVALGL
ncbi:hypothetical protein ABI_09270 [Asticcacaulis biprosthecium C19]|uniref:Uncharacterized protein n=1 Tax=Asticcacaulis biprosthecium C19 TaxID=715226 RepID=F4QGN8_9CAUL|nr:hypothetical protein [Asticcacaulis biprosthecium]EGF92490.1 hypothetical protein ABI_09270 [Asticcacaulis biprosthecium C19]